MSVAVELEARRTRGDIFSGILANMIRSPSTLGWYVGGAAIVAAIAIAVNWDEGGIVMLIAGLVVFALMIALYSFILFFCVLAAAHKTWSSAGALDPIKYRLSDDGLGVEASVGHGLTHWTAWKTAFETKALIVIRHELNLLHILPKRGLSEETLSNIRAVLSAHLKTTHLWPREGRA